MRALAAAIDAAYPRLSPQEQRLADLLRHSPDEAALSTGAELALQAGVSKATVSRLYRRLGFTGASEVRSLLRSERSERAAGQPVAARGRPQDDRVARHFRSELQILTRLAESLDAEAVTAAARVLAGARSVLVIGWRSGYPIALGLRQQLAQAREGVRLAPEPGQSLGEELEGLTAADAVVVVALRRRPADAAEVLRSVAVGPTTLVVITDPSGRRAAAGADIAFECPVGAPGAFDSHAAAASLVSLLADEVFTAIGRPAADRAGAIALRYARLREVEAR